MKYIYIYKEPQSTTSSKELGANLISDSTIKEQNQQNINSKELDANIINYNNKRRHHKQQSTSPKGLGANDNGNDNQEEKHLVVMPVINQNSRNNVREHNYIK